MDKEKLKSYLYEISDFELLIKKSNHDTLFFNKALKKQLEGYLSVTQLSDIEFIPDFQWFINHIAVTENIIFAKHMRFIETPFHNHNFIELSYVYSGKITQVINGQKIFLKKGCFLITNSKVQHSIHKAEEEDILINCLIGKDVLNYNFLSLLNKNQPIYNFFLSFLYDDNPNQFFVFDAANHSDIKDLFELMLCEYYSNTPSNNQIIKCYLAALLIKLFSIQKNQYTNHYAISSNTLDSLSVLNYISSHLKTVTLKDTAHYFGYNADYFCRIFKDTHNHKFTEVVKACRLEKAVCLLSSTNITIKDIASIVGYTNTSFFYKVFYDCFGVTPATFRKTLSICKFETDTYL